jgi:hypothetical protein
MVPGFCLKAPVLQNSMSNCQRGVVSALRWEVTCCLVHNGDIPGGLVKEVHEQEWEKLHENWKKVFWRAKFPTKKAFLLAPPAGLKSQYHAKLIWLRLLKGSSLFRDIAIISPSSNKLLQEATSFKLQTRTDLCLACWYCNLIALQAFISYCMSVNLL